MYSLAQDGAQQVANLGECKLSSGESIRDCRVGYRTWGTLNERRDNAVVFLTWFCGNTGSLDFYIGKGKAFDPSKWYVVAIDALGNGVSSSPSNSTTQPRMKFPQFTIGDMVNSQYRLLTEVIKVDHVHAIAGASMGGMQSFQWATAYPEFMDVIVPLVGTPRQTSYDLLLWRAQLNAITSHVDWKDGNYDGHPQLKAVSNISALHLQSPAYYVEHNAAASYPEFAEKSESGDKFDWNNRVRQLQAMMSHDIAPGSDWEAIAKKIKAKMFIIVASQDQMVNPAPALALAKASGAKTLVTDSSCGHVAVGCDGARILPEIREFLDSTMPVTTR